MKISIRELRKVISNTILEVKLGVASANPPGQYFDQDADENDDLETSTFDDLKKIMLSKGSFPFQPGDKALKASDRYVKAAAKEAEYDFNVDDENGTDDTIRLPKSDSTMIFDKPKYKNSDLTHDNFSDYIFTDSDAN